jgi:proline dehydrogenase
MLRQSLLFLSESETIRKVVTGTGATRRLVDRFVAGESIEDAVRVAQGLNGSGLSVSLDYLGELVTTREEAIAASQVAIRTLEQIAVQDVRGNISLKPSQLGLQIDEAFCLENVERILGRARELGDGGGEIFVRLDMEASDSTEATIRLVETLWERGYRNVGTVVQSYLRRALDDIRRLNALGSRIRLVKGAYNEPPSVAFQAKADVDRKFVSGMQILLQEGVYPAIATHDEALISATRRFAFEHGIPRNSFEFQMLYGVRRDLQHRLREEGYEVRVYIPFGESWYPYLMRRMAERPANLLFVAGSVVKESPARGLGQPWAVGAGVLAGIVMARAWRGGGNSR